MITLRLRRRRRARTPATAGQRGSTRLRLGRPRGVDIGSVVAKVGGDKTLDVGASVQDTRPKPHIGTAAPGCPLAVERAQAASAQTGKFRCCQEFQIHGRHLSLPCDDGGRRENSADDVQLNWGVNWVFQAPRGSENSRRRNQLVI